MTKLHSSKNNQTELIKSDFYYLKGIQEMYEYIQYKVKFGYLLSRSGYQLNNGYISLYIQHR